jgi:hypothetical protein
VASVAISKEARDHISRKKRPNIIVYQDVFRAGKRGLLFIPKVALTSGREPGSQFAVQNQGGIPVWVEKGLLNSLPEGDLLLIGMQRGLIKSLKIELVSERLERA